MIGLLIMLGLFLVIMFLLGRIVYLSYCNLTLGRGYSYNVTFWQVIKGLILLALCWPTTWLIIMALISLWIF